MYEILMDGKELWYPGDKECVVLSPSLTQALNDSGYIEFKIPPGNPYKDYTFDTKRYLKEPRFIGVLLGIVYDHQHAIKDKDEHYALSL